MKNEFQFIERLKSLIPRRLQGRRGIGDDAAILAGCGGKSCLFTADVIVEGVDFLKTSKPEAVGHKALAVNLSDIAAMGGRPVAFVAAWGLPRNFSQARAERIAKGMIRLARRFNVLWAGGDLSKADRLFISVALIGEAPSNKIIERKGARPGDFIYVTGSLGGSLAGKHLSFMPRLEEGQFLSHRFWPTAMIDLSDGFIQDLEHILRASCVSATVDVGRIPVSRAALRRSGESRSRALRAALTDGEDFELLFTIHQKQARALEQAWRRRVPRLKLTRVGEICRGQGTIEWFDCGKKIKFGFLKKGFTHF